MAGPMMQSEDGGPLWVTAESVDPLYNQPVIDSATDLTSPVPHHKVSGHFEGTYKRFKFYFPPKEQWEGRFFHLVYPLIDENATDEVVSFGVDSGAYTVQTNGGGGYRVDAAAAKFSRTVAAAYYGEPNRRIYGYIYGGSGGSYQTVGAIENCAGVWDGAVPFVPAIPTSIPNSPFILAFARFVLAGKAPHIADAVRPGGSGDPYAGIDDVERAVLLEVTRMGVPLRAWEDYVNILGLHNPAELLSFAGTVRGFDPSYADDFWSKPGYLGMEQSALGDLFRAARIDHMATITKVNRDGQHLPASLSLDSAPTIPTTTVLDYTLYAVDDATTPLPLSGSLDPTGKVFTLGSGNAADVLNAIDRGDKLRIDNRWSLALISYHRHQVPQQPDFYAWNQFRAPDGQPIYPQRPIEVGPIIARSVTGGGTHTGMVHGKVILIVNLLDVGAHPWNGDWYSARVRKALGERYGDTFRLWYNDNADHFDGPVVGSRATHIVQYDGIVQQALRDVSAWAEQGIAAPASTGYSVNDAQVAIPPTAAERRGIQPVVTLTANGGVLAEVGVGEPVRFNATIEVPPGAGEVVSATWDFEGQGDFPTAAEFTPDGETPARVTLQASYTFSRPGTYFPALRGVSQRNGDGATRFARVQNLDRVRVVVGGGDRVE